MSAACRLAGNGRRFSNTVLSEQRRVSTPTVSWLPGRLFSRWRLNRGDGYAQEFLPLSSHVLELLIPLRRILGAPLPVPDIGPHREPHSSEQGPYGLVTDG